MASKHESSTAEETWVPSLRAAAYMVSSLGRVMRVKGGQATHSGRILTPCPGRGGYPRVTLRIDNKPHTAPVHQLVCEAFHGPRPSPRHQVAHKDGIRTNCHETNLRWATPRENEADKRSHGTAQVGERNGNAKFSDEIIRAVRAASGTHREIGRRFGVSKSNVSYIKSNTYWSHI